MPREEIVSDLVATGQYTKRGRHIAELARTFHRYQLARAVVLEQIAAVAGAPVPQAAGLISPHVS